MMPVNIEEIKKYNQSLKQYKDKAASLTAEIEYNNREIDNLCKELSAELGVEVTRDNIEEIYNDQVNKINSMLQTGTTVLQKIANEESKAEVQAPVEETPVATTASANPVTPTNPVNQMPQFSFGNEPERESHINVDVEKTPEGTSTTFELPDDEDEEPSNFGSFDPNKIPPLFNN